MFIVTKVPKLLMKLEGVVSYMEMNQDLFLHRHVNQYLHIERISELKVLQEEYLKSQHRLQTISHYLDEAYARAYRSWKNDVLWINRCFVYPHLCREPALYLREHPS